MSEEIQESGMDFNEISVGDIVTVLRWIKKSDRSWVGDALEVKAIQEPFLVLERYQGNAAWRWTTRITLDIREVEIVALTEEFLEARYPPKPEPTEVETDD